MTNPVIYVCKLSPKKECVFATTAIGTPVVGNRLQNDSFENHITVHYIGYQIDIGLFDSRCIRWISVVDLPQFLHRLIVFLNIAKYIAS